MPIQLLISPTGEEMIQMIRSEYEDLVDARDHAIAMQNVASGKMPILSDDDMDAYLSAPTPLAFWRKYRGLTQTQLAAAVEVTQPHIAQIENGRKEASTAIYAKIARQLNVRIDDLVVPYSSTKAVATTKRNRPSQVKSADRNPNTTLT